MLLAYYMFVNHGWNPQRTADLPYRERVLMLHMALKEIDSRKKLEGKS